MKVLNRVILVAALALYVCAYAAAQEMTKEEWQKQITESTAQRNELKSKLTALQAEVDKLKKTDAEKAAALKKCNDEVMALVAQMLPRSEPLQQSSTRSMERSTSSLVYPTRISGHARVRLMTCKRCLMKQRRTN